VARLTAALGTTPGDLFPTSAQPDDLAVIRQQLRTLFEGVVASENRQPLSLLAQFLARLSETGR